MKERGVAEIESFVEAIPGIALDVVDDQDARIVLSDGIHDKVEFNFARHAAVER